MTLHESCKNKRPISSFALSALYALFALPVFSYDYDFGYEYWKLSFFSPSRAYSVLLTEKSSAGSSSLEYRRTSRFNYEDNTFGMYWAEAQNNWGWEFSIFVTPEAQVMPRHAENLSVYLPGFWLPFSGLEPYFSAGFRRYSQASVSNLSAAVKQKIASNWDITIRGQRTRTQFKDSAQKSQYSSARSIELGFDLSAGARAWAWQARWKEFFDSGNPISALDFTSDEKGGGLIFNLSSGLYLKATHALEERTGGATIRKYNFSLGQKY